MPAFFHQQQGFLDSNEQDFMLPQSQEPLGQGIPFWEQKQPEKSQFSLTPKKQCIGSNRQYSVVLLLVLATE